MPLTKKVAICIAVGMFLFAANARGQNSGAPTEFGRLAAGMKPGTWAELKCDNLIETLKAKGASGAIFGYNEDAVWDPKTRQFYYVGGDHNDMVRFVTYQDKTNAWKTLPQPPWVGKGT